MDNGGFWIWKTIVLFIYVRPNMCKSLLSLIHVFACIIQEGLADNFLLRYHFTTHVVDNLINDHFSRRRPRPAPG